MILHTKNTSQIRRDFEVFAQGIERLKELRNELDSLDTTGFSKEEQSIRSKLKNVSDIPIIERELRVLSEKIKKGYRKEPRRKGSYSWIKKDIGEIKSVIPEIKNQITNLSRKVSELGETDEIAKIKREISQLNERSKNIEKLSDVSQLIKKVELLSNKIENEEKLHHSTKGKHRAKKRASHSWIKRDIGEIKSVIPEIKNQITNLSRKVGELGETDELVKVKEEITKLNEKSKNIEKLSDIPKLMNKVELLSSKLDLLSKGREKEEGKVDSEVDVLVGRNFSNLLNDVKLGLSKRVEKKEAEISDYLKADLEKRKEEYKRKYDSLEREFSGKREKLESELNRGYQKKLREELHKEVIQRFNEELRKKIEAKRIELAKKYKVGLRKHTQEKLKEEEQGLKNKYKKELGLFEAQKQKFFEDSQKKLKEEEKKLKEELLDQLHKKIEKEFTRKKEIVRVELRKHAQEKLKQEEQGLKNKYKKELGLFEAKKQKFFEDSQKKLKEEEASLREKLIKQLHGFHRDIEKELLEKEKEMLEQRLGEKKGKKGKKLKPKIKRKVKIEERPKIENERREPKEQRPIIEKLNNIKERFKGLFTGENQEKINNEKSTLILKNKIIRIKEELNKLDDAYKQGVIEEDGYKKTKENLLKKIENLNQKKA